MLGAFYSPDTNFKVIALVGPPASNLLYRVDLDMFGKVLISCFLKGMDLENPTVESKVIFLKVSDASNRCVIPVFVTSRPF